MRKYILRYFSVFRLSSLIMMLIIMLSGCNNGTGKSNGNAEFWANTFNSEVQSSNVHSSATYGSKSHESSDPHKNLSAEKYLQVALQHLNEGRLSLAMDTLNHALGKYADSANLYGVRGSLYLQQKSSSAALADLSKAIELDPHNPGYYTNRAQAYRAFGQNSDAVTDLDRAIKLDKGFVAALFNRGSLAFNNGKYSQALSDFDACIELDPQTAAAYFNRASVHDAMGNRKTAIQDMQQFLQMASSQQWRDAAKTLLLKWNEAKQSSMQAGIS